jgi:hypothetical protein
MPSFESAARSLRVELITAPVHSDVEIETAIIALGREPGGGLVALGEPFITAHRASTILACDNDAAMAEGSRRFPPPWRADKMPGGYVVRDANDQAIAHIYSRETEAEALQAKVLTKDEARRIAVNIARLPELLGKGEHS